MSATHPYAGTSAERLLAGINQSAGTNYQLGVDFVFGPASAMHGSPQRNSKALLVPVDQVVFADQFVYYNRLSVEVLTRLPEGEIVPVNINHVPFTIHGILDEINIAFGLNLVPSEVFNDYKATEEESYVLRFTDKSLCWLPGAIVFQSNIILEQGDVRFMEDDEVRLEEDEEDRLMESDIIPVI